MLLTTGLRVQVADYLPGESGYRSFWLRTITAASVLLLVYGSLDIVRVSQAQRDGQDLVGTVVVTVTVTFGAFLILWGLSGVGPWALMRRLPNGEQSTVAVSQRSPALVQALSDLSGKDVSGPFYFIVQSDRQGVRVFARGSAILELPWSQVGDVVPASTPVRGLDLPCVTVSVSNGASSIRLPFQLSRNPWRALFPTSPKSLRPFSADILKFRPGPV